jgi:hypothetical protein
MAYEEVGCRDGFGNLLYMAQELVNKCHNIKDLNVHHKLRVDIYEFR